MENHDACANTRILLVRAWPVNGIGPCAHCGYIRPVATTRVEVVCETHGEQNAEGPACIDCFAMVLRSAERGELMDKNGETVQHGFRNGQRTDGASLSQAFATDVAKRPAPPNPLLN